jgi:hypothetical protein
MALVLRGKEFIATEALSAHNLSSLAALAARRPLILNGIKMCAQDLTRLAEEALRAERPVWPEALAVCATCYPDEGLSLG